jgi:hypothetical protein
MDVAKRVVARGDGVRTLARKRYPRLDDLGVDSIRGSVL